MSIQNTNRQGDAMFTPNDPENPLNALATKVKSRRFRRLLPIIEARITEGVRHIDIIHALRELGLDLSESTYFTYLQRHRAKQSIGAKRAAEPEDSRTRVELPTVSAASNQTGRTTNRRPPTFEHDPKGNPDLLK